MYETPPEIVSRAEARKRGLKRYFTGKACVNGHISPRWLNTRCEECAHTNAGVYRERTRERGRAYRERTRERARAATRAWQRANPARVNATCMARKARKLQATLPGHEGELRMVYAEACRGEHVDHIVPLNHPLVCGLHVPWNLQFLPASVNTSKKNSFDPSGPQGALGYV